MSELDLKEELIREKLSETDFLNDVHVFDEVDSTNEFLKKKIESLKDKTLVVAEVQTAGKGSKGRSWSSPKGSGIWMSLLLRPEIPVEKVSGITLVMAHSIARACRELYGLKVDIKWPNDIVYNGKKICGILTELKTLDKNNYGVIIGIGINVNTKVFPEELKDRATSIAMEIKKERCVRAELIAKAMDCFREDYRKFLQKQDLSLLLHTYCEMSATIGRQVRIMDLRGEYQARAISVGSDGCLIVELENGETRKIFGDEVSVRGIYGYI